MYKHILAIIFLFVQITCYSQNDGYEKIKNIDYFKPSRTTSLNDTLKIETWAHLSFSKKQRILKAIKKSVIDIRNDSSSVLQLLYYGLPETIRIISDDTLLIHQKLTSESSKYGYFVHDYPSKTKTFEIGQLKRNTGIHILTIYFERIHRYCTIEIDTSYSEVYLEPQTDIELIDFVEDDPIEINEDGIPLPAKTRLIKMEDKISVNYRIPSLKPY